MRVRRRGEIEGREGEQESVSKKREGEEGEREMGVKEGKEEEEGERG